MLPGDRDGHVLAFGIEDAAGRVRGRAPRPRRHGGVDHRAGRRRLPRPSVLDRRNPGTLELPDTVSGIEVFNAGCELELGRGLSTVHWDELLDAGRLCYAIASDDSHHPGFDSDLAWTWVRAEPTVDGRARGAPHAAASTARRGRASRSVVAGGGSVEVQCDPCSSVRVVFGVSSGAAVNAGPPRLPLRRRDPRHQRRRAHHGCAARPARDRPVCPGRGRRRPRRQSLDEPTVTPAAWREAARAELARAPFDLLVVGGGIVGAGIASEAARLGLRVALVDRSDFGGATSSASSKLIHGGLRYLQARRRQARPRGARRTASAAPRRRTASRPPDPVHVPGLPRRPIPAGDDPGRASGRTRRSRATSSAVSSSPSGRGVAFPRCASTACAAAASTRTPGRTTDGSASPT